MSSERISSDLAQSQQERFRSLLERSVAEVPSDGEVFEQWDPIIPREGYGNISLNGAPREFIDSYRSHLEAGTFSTFIHDAVATSDDYSSIYFVKSKNPETLSALSRKTWENYQNDFLAQIEGKLESFINYVQGSDIEEAYKKEYQLRAGEALKHIGTAPLLSTPEFTSIQNSPQGWAEFIDVDRSIQSGQVLLPYEDLARETLMASRENPPAELSAYEGLEKWNLSEEEKDYIGFEGVEKSARKIDPEKGARLFEILLTRLRLDEAGWVIVRDPDKTALTVNSKAKKIYFPTNRELSGDDIPYVPGHEFLHALRGRNGEMQGMRMLYTGVAGNEMPEEGVGSVGELVMGEPFGHPKQVKIAGRYLAVAMMLKAKEEDGVVTPLYTPQEIYDEIVELGVGKKDASDIIWRISRGTSLLHKGTHIEVEENDETIRLPAAECFAKDAAYFEGQNIAFEWIKKYMPVYEGARHDLTLGGNDFSDRSLVRVGRSVTDMENLTGEGIRERYEQLKAIGRETLIDIVNRLALGKYRFDFLDEGSPWWDLLKTVDQPGMIDYRNILKPRG